MKTNAARLLEREGIPYRLLEYSLDAGDLGAATAARKLGLPVAQVFKTLVCRCASNRVCFAVIAGDCELDLKGLARALGERRAEIVALREIQPLTGYVRGGVTVLGAKRRYPAVVDASALGWPQLAVSAGARGAELMLTPQDYIRVTEALVVKDLGRRVRAAGASPAMPEAGEREPD